jgi:hypothetical protein
MESLATDGQRWKGKKERKQQRNLFRDYAATVSEGASPVDTGR